MPDTRNRIWSLLTRNLALRRGAHASTALGANQGAEECAIVRRVTSDSPPAARRLHLSRPRISVALGAFLVTAFVLCALLAPLLTRFVGYDPYEKALPRSVVPPTPPARDRRPRPRPAQPPDPRSAHLARGGVARRDHLSRPRDRPRGGGRLRRRKDRCRADAVRRSLLRLPRAADRPGDRRGDPRPRERSAAAPPPPPIRGGRLPGPRRPRLGEDRPPGAWRIPEDPRAGIRAGGRGDRRARRPSGGASPPPQRPRPPDRRGLARDRRQHPYGGLPVVPRSRRAPAPSVVGHDGDRGAGLFPEQALGRRRPRRGDPSGGARVQPARRRGARADRSPAAEDRCVAFSRRPARGPRTAPRG